MSVVTSVHLKVVRCHQFKKRHHMRLLLKVFADLEKVFSSKWRCPPWEAFHWWRGECSIDTAVRLIVGFSVGVSPGQEGIVLRMKRQTHDFLESAEVSTHRLSGPPEKYSQSIQSKDIKWCHLVLVRVPPLNKNVMHPWINSWHFDSCGRRKNNLVRAFPDGLKRLPPDPNVFIRTSVPGSNRGLLDSEAGSGVVSWSHVNACWKAESWVT